MCACVLSKSKVLHLALRNSRRLVCLCIFSAEDKKPSSSLVTSATIRNALITHFSGKSAPVTALYATPKARLPLIFQPISVESTPAAGGRLDGAALSSSSCRGHCNIIPADTDGLHRVSIHFIKLLPQFTSITPRRHPEAVGGRGVAAGDVLQPPL